MRESVSGVCKNCRGKGFTLDPEALGVRDQVCPTCRGIGVLESGKPLSGSDVWLTRAVLAFSLPATWVRDLLWFGRSYAWRMAKEHWRELRAAWEGIDTSDIPEADEAWFKRSRLRQPDEPLPLPKGESE